MSMVVYVMLHTIWIWDSTFRLSASMSLLRSSSAPCVIKRLRMSWQKVTSYGPDNSSKGVCLMRRRAGCLFVNVDRVVVAISKTTLYKLPGSFQRAMSNGTMATAPQLRFRRDHFYRYPVCSNTYWLYHNATYIQINLNYIYRTSLHNPQQQWWPQGSISKTIIYHNNTCTNLNRLISHK